MPSLNKAMYRDITYVPNRILKAQELEILQNLYESADKHGIGALFREGGTLNMKTVISGENISLEAIDNTKPMYVFIGNRFEAVEPVVVSLSAQADNAKRIYLNWILYKVTYNTAGTINDPDLIDVATSEKTAEMGQLWFALENIDRSGTALDSATQLAKNTTPVVVYEFERLGSGLLGLKDTYERVKTHAMASPDNAGLVRISHGSGPALGKLDPEYVQLKQRVTDLEALHPNKIAGHVDWSESIDQIQDRLDHIKLPPDWVPPAPQPFLRVEPEVLDFTNTRKNKSVTKSFELVNFGDGPGEYTIVNEASGYAFVVQGPSSGIIQARSSITFHVTFSPTTDYLTPVGGAIKINNTLVVTVTGTTVNEDEAPEFMFSETTIDFGEVVTEDFAIRRVSIENIGELSGEYQLVLPAGAFVVSDDGTNPMNRTLAPGGDAEIQIMFRPATEQTYAANITFESYGRNACALKGVGGHRFVGPRFRFLTESLSFALKQTANQKQVVMVKNVGDQAGSPSIFTNNDSAYGIEGSPFPVLQPGDSCAVTVVGKAAMLGNHGGMIGFQSFGENYCNLTSVVGSAAAPKFTFQSTSLNFGTVSYNAGIQSLTVSVQNTGDAAGIPDIAVTQAQGWFIASYTKASVNPGSSVTVTVKISPNADMAPDTYPDITGALTCANGTNSCALTVTVTGPVFEIIPELSENPGIVDFGSYYEFNLKVKNTGLVTGTARIRVVGSGWTLTPTGQSDPVWALTAGAEGNFKVRFTAAAPAFGHLLNLISGNVYEFAGIVIGDAMYVKPGRCVTRAKYLDNRAPKFSSRPNSGNIFSPIRLPDFQVNTAAGTKSKTIVTVYNVGTASGRPVFTLTSGDNVFSISRTGIAGDPEIPPGGSGLYEISADAAAIASPTAKTARYSLDDGGFDFQINWIAEAFKTRFEDHAGNPITEINLGIWNYYDTAYATTSVYLKRISSVGTAANEGIRVQANSNDSSSNGVVINPQGSLLTAARIAVFIGISPPRVGSSSSKAVIVADHGITPLTVNVTWSFESNESSNESQGSLPIYGTVQTPYGSFYTSDQSLVGTYVSNPSWSGAPGSSVVSGNNG